MTVLVVCGVWGAAIVLTLAVWNLCKIYVQRRAR